MTHRARRLLWIGALAGVLLISWGLSSRWNASRPDLINYSELARLAKTNAFQSTPLIPLTLTSGRLKGRYLDPKSQSERDFEVILPTGSQRGLADTLVSQGYIVKVEQEARSSWTYFLAAVALPLVLLSGFVLLTLRRQMQRNSDPGRNSLGKSRAKLWMKEQKDVTFDEVAGADEAKEELQEIVEFLKDPNRFRRLGGKIPGGVLLTGPPGTGKTLLARALAGEAGVPFFSISASEFVEIFVGVGASRVRDLFAVGRRHAPCIIFIDEIDSIGRHRGAGLGGGHDEREQALNQLLSEMDGFESTEGVIVLGATNRPDVLDPALLRPGRFDRHVVVELPDLRGREGILSVHMRRIPVSEDVVILDLARSTQGFSGAQLANLVNEAAIRGARSNRESVTMSDFLEEKDKSVMGRERRSLVLSARDRTGAAYREAAHALVAWLLPETDRVQKVTIVPRANVLGTTVQMPEGDRHSSTKGRLESAIAVLMARRCAEEMFLSSPSSAVASDLRKATALARKMVCEWGMGDETGPVSLGKETDAVFLGKVVARHRPSSRVTSACIDDAVRNLVLQGYRTAKAILERGRSTVERVAEALQEQETLDASQLAELISPIHT